MGDKEKAMLLIRAAKRVGDDADARALLSMAEDILSGAYSPSATMKTSVGFPVSIFARHKGTKYDASLQQAWKVQLNGTTYASPSAAAVHIAGYPVNGWRFWRYVNERGEERPIDDLRK